ncbi:MAG: hypothetical protein H7Y17_17085 [Chlorobia bacterium]|nr:hypothetical protein [Fimbriimonadaceae bacterium]
MSAPYRRASRHDAVWLFIILGGIAFAIFSTSKIPNKDSFGAWLLLIVAIPIIASIVVAVIVTSLLNRKRVKGIRKALTRRGFRFDAEPDQVQKDAFFAPLEHLGSWLGLQGGATNVQWVAASDTVGVFEHQYLVGSGKTTQEFLHTVLVFQDPIGFEYGMTAFRAGYVKKRAILRGQEEFQIGDEAFDKDWVLFGEPAIAKRFFRHSVQQLLLDSPKGETWAIGNGYVGVSFEATFNGANMEKFLDRAKRVISEASRG